MYRHHDRSRHFGPGFWIRPRSQAALFEPDENEAPALVRMTRQLLDTVRSITA